MEHKHEKAVITKKAKGNRDAKNLKIFGQILACLRELETESDDAKYLKQGVLNAVESIYDRFEKGQEEKVLGVIGKIIKLLNEFDKDEDYDSENRYRDILNNVWPLSY